MLNLPNTISAIRILLVPVFLWMFWYSSGHHILPGMFILAVAGITDIIDGHLARKYNLITPLGKILDPMADKLMILAVMTSLFLVGRFPFWLVVLIVFKELLLVVGSFFVVIREKAEISANVYGKAATISVYLALFSSAFKIPGSGIIAGFAGIVSVLALSNYVRIFIRRRAF